MGFCAVPQPHVQYAFSRPARRSRHDVGVHILASPAALSGRLFGLLDAFGMLTSAQSSDRKGEAIPLELQLAPPAPQTISHGCRIDTDFACAGRHGCTFGPRGELVISVAHERLLGGRINPSPWYALRITSQRPGVRTIVLDYAGHRHRYAPYLSLDGRNWIKVPADHVELNADATRARLQLDLPAGEAILASQPLSSSASGVEWARSCLVHRGFEEVRYGASIENRPLVGFLGGSKTAQRMVVAMTRQHPPETTGEEAFKGFIDRLSGRDDLLANRFRATHRIVLAPMPNPDGVDAGNWRLNAGGVDLNRDWGPFTQPETRALSRFILGEASGREVVSMMDFHSTDRTTIYAPPRDQTSSGMGLMTSLESHFNAAFDAPLDWVHGHVSAGHSSKRWAIEALKAPGLTIELADTASRTEAHALGAAAADGLIGYFAP